MKFLLAFIIVIFSVCLFVDCSKNNVEIYSTSGSANGATANPPNSSKGTAKCDGIYNKHNKRWDYVVTWKDFSSAATTAEFRNVTDLSVDGNILTSIGIVSGDTSGTVRGSVVLTAAQEAQLLSNNCYFDIPSHLYLNGEVRGKVIVSK